MPADVVQVDQEHYRNVDRTLASNVECQELYRWAPLENPKDIRLLRIERPETVDAPIQVSLDIVSLTEDPSFATLSYVWGKTCKDGSHLTHVIWCNGLPLLVTESLHRALWAIRSQLASGKLAEQGTKLPLWADAACIDQANDAERSAQVALMARIYATSKHLFVWLGKVHDETQHRSNAASSSTSKALSNVQKVLLHIGGVESQDRITEAMRKDAAVVLYRRNWFHRRWVIQEVMHSNSADFLVGEYMIPLKAFRRISARITTPKMLMRFKRGTNTNAFTTYDLLTHLVEYEYAECSDPRDRIYALLGVSADGKKFEVDYTLSTANLFLKTAKYFVEHGQAINMFTRATCKNPDRATPTPSWVPDFCYGRYKSQLHWRAASRRQEIQNVWGGANSHSNIEVVDRSLRMNAWVLGPCFQKHETDASPCAICASSTFVPPFGKEWQGWGLINLPKPDTSRWQVMIFPPDENEMSCKHEKVVFIVQRKAEPQGQGEYQNDVERGLGCCPPDDSLKRELEEDDSSHTPKRQKIATDGKDFAAIPLSHVGRDTVDRYELVACMHMELDLQALSARLDEVEVPDTSAADAVHTDTLIPGHRSKVALNRLDHTYRRSILIV